MTYAAGFRTEHGLYLTVDSASTGGAETAIHSDTFFGEQAVHDTYAITDNAMKLFKISTHRLVAAAGDSQAIYQSIKFLKENSEIFEKPPDLFSSLQESLYLPKNTIKLIFAEFSKSGFELGIWQSGQEYEIPCNAEGNLASALCTGSGMVFSYLTENVAKSIRLITEKTIKNNLAFISCCHQLHGVHANHTLNNVGGAFITAAVTKDGVVWQPDITYFKYSPSIMRDTTPGEEKLKMFYPINIMVREGAVFIEKRVPEYRAIYMNNAISHEESIKIRERHEKEAENIALNLSCEYGAFLSSDDPYAVLIHHFSDEYCYENVILKGTAQITISEDVYALLLEKPKLNNMVGAMKVFCVPKNFLKPNYSLPELK
ncbi:MAG: hypothetical protein H8E41_09705 [Desulfobulbaceae bacterium]|uniref:Uncharacterized protein n=1 Tax=Candidatus Desulfobia pelagia TaxID=2841692 RepID=A0A8J6TGG8_9BACT|nr:hypothetical protein [Candidatus Desulfobia pelagia]